MRDSSVRRLSLYRLLESMFEDIHCDVITGQGKSECGFAHRFSPLLFERVATFSSFHLRIRNWLSSYVRESKTVLDSGFEAWNSIFQELDSSLCRWNLDSGFQSLVGFRILSAVFRIPQAKFSWTLEPRFPYLVLWKAGRTSGTNENLTGSSLLRRLWITRSTTNQ